MKNLKDDSTIYTLSILFHPGSVVYRPTKRFWSMGEKGFSERFMQKMNGWTLLGPLSGLNLCSLHELIQETAEIGFSVFSAL